MRNTYEEKQGKCVAVVLAAGQGKRMNSTKAKQYMELHGKPVLYYSLKVLEESFIDEILLVTGRGEEAYCREEFIEKYGFRKIKKIVQGGAQRYHSVYNGLKALEKDEAVRYVFIHDGVRPFLSREILERTWEAVRTEDACAVGVPVTDTIKVADERGFVADTPDRERLWSMQTPQAFEYRLIMDAYETLICEEDNLLAKGIHITDDSMVAELILHLPVKIVEGSYDNMKITTPEDLAKAEILFEKREKAVK